MKDKRMLILVLITIFLALAVQAHAATPQFLDSPFMKNLWEWLKTPIDWPPWGTDEQDLVPPGLIIVVSILLTCIIWAVTRQRISFFQDDKFRNAALWFALAFSAIPIFGTHFVGSISGVIGGAFEFSTIIYFVIGIFMLIAIGKWGAGFSGIRGGQIGEAVGERVHHEAGRAAGVIRGQAGREERNLAQEAQLFQGVDNLERVGVRDAAALERYINEIINLLGSGQSLRQIADGINARLGRLNASFGALVAVNARATALDTQLNTAITTETRRLGTLMRTVRQRQIGPGAVVPRAEATLVGRYTADLTRRLNDARTTSINMAANGPRLTALEAQIRARLAAGLATIGNPALNYAQRVRTARTEFTQAAAFVNELVGIMNTVEREAERIRNDLMRELTDVNAEDHLARAGVV